MSKLYRGCEKWWKGPLVIAFVAKDSSYYLCYLHIWAFTFNPNFLCAWIFETGQNIPYWNSFGHTSCHFEIQTQSGILYCDALLWRCQRKWKVSCHQWSAQMFRCLQLFWIFHKPSRYLVELHSGKLSGICSCLCNLFPGKLHRYWE